MTTSNNEKMYEISESRLRQLLEYEHDVNLIGDYLYESNADAFINCENFDADNGVWLTIDEDLAKFKEIKPRKDKK